MKYTSNKITRRDFIIGGSSLLLLGCSKNNLQKAQKPIPGNLLGPNNSIGHKLISGNFNKPAKEIQVPVLIAGSGIAGLNCGWWLQRNGINDFQILELESSYGGNARSDKNAISSFPLGAHYLPLPGPEAEYVRILLAELGVLKGDSDDPMPEYDETMLVNAPDERLYINGRWQDGLIPKSGIGNRAQKEIEQFEALMAEWSTIKGNDGKFLFTIPSASGSKDASFSYLDSISFHSWIMQQHLTSEALHWYISYCCRDDFGADHTQISAWAGLHYFCCRRGFAKNAEPQSVITAPEGNGWIVKKLTQKLCNQLQGNQAVFNIQANKLDVAVDVYNSETDEVTRIRCNHLVWAAPLFILPHIWHSAPAIHIPEYAPWLVANLSINNINENEFTTWDNVIYKGQGLGYVDATHQHLQYRRPNRVLTYYNALSHLPPKAGRQLLLHTSHEEWSRQIFGDLKKAHPAIEQHCTAIDIWRWPHAMAIPSPGFLSQLASRQQIAHPNIHLAHSDLSGFSLFEEAQYWGVTAAKKIITALT